MISSAILSVSCSKVTFTINLPCDFFVVFNIILEVIFINKVTTCIVWWVNIYRLDLIVPPGADQSKRLKVVTMNK